MRAEIIEALPFHRFLLSTGLLVITPLALTPAALSQNIRKHTEVVQHFNSELKNASAPLIHQVASAQKRLSAKAEYITLADALKRARAEGGSGEVLQVDLEWDEARSTVTWDMTFASGTEYEVDAFTGKFLGTKAKGTDKLALLAPLALQDRGMLTFQEIIRKAEAERGQSVMEMELKRTKGSQETKFEVVLADGTAILYNATTGKALTGL